MARSLSFVFAAGVVLAAVPALAQSIKPGTYVGPIMDGNRPIRVELILGVAKDDSVKFGEPWACALRLQYAGPRPPVETYSITGTSARPCDMLRGGYAEIVPASVGIQVGLFDQQRRQQMMLTAGPELAQDVIQPGTYRGAMYDGDRPLPVQLTLDGAKGGSMRFGEPWACQFALQYAGPRERVQVYSFTGAGAGRCNMLSRGYAEIGPSPDGRLAAGLFDQSQQRRQQVTLFPQ